MIQVINLIKPHSHRGLCRIISQTGSHIVWLAIIRIRPRTLNRLIKNTSTTLVFCINTQHVRPRSIPCHTERHIYRIPPDNHGRFRYLERNSGPYTVCYDFTQSHANRIRTPATIFTRLDSQLYNISLVVDGVAVEIPQHPLIALRNLRYVRFVLRTVRSDSHDFVRFPIPRIFFPIPQAINSGIFCIAKIRRGNAHNRNNRHLQIIRFCREDDIRMPFASMEQTCRHADIPYHVNASSFEIAFSVISPYQIHVHIERMRS